jgi:phospholipid/cholesterol/gamma-HCH transport system permease protein
MLKAPTFSIVKVSSAKIALKFAGAFEVENWRLLKQLKPEIDSQTTHISLDFAAVEGLDTFGAWQVVRLWKQFEAQGQKVTLENCKEAELSFLKEVYALKVPLQARKTKHINIVEQIGQSTLDTVHEFHRIIALLGKITLLLTRCVRNPQSFRYKSFFHFIDETGIRALPIVGLVSFLIGVVLVYQGVNQLDRFGAQIFTVNLLAVSVLRELGILLTAIVVAGRSGSAFTAQIGFMKLNQELDAMKVLGLEPYELLVVPRVLALMVTLPLLTLYCDLVALAGGAFMSMQLINLSFDQFQAQLLTAIQPWTFWTGMIKAPVFALTIVLIACYEGLQVTGGAESVGRHTTRSVVKSIFMVIVLDAIFSILFAKFGV